MRWKILLREDFLLQGCSRHFWLLLFGGKTQSSIFNNFNNSYFVAIVTVLLLIDYPIEKHFKEGYIFSVFSSGSAFFSNLAGFESQKFYRLS